MATFTRDDGAVHTKRLWLPFASAVLLVIGLVPLGVAAVTSGSHLLTLMAFAAYFAVGFGPISQWNRWPRERRGRLRADEEGLWLSGVLVVRRSAIRHGHVLRRKGVVVVRLERWFRPVEVLVEDDEEGAALLAGLRLDAARSVGRYVMSRGTLRAAWIKAAAMMALFISATFGFLVLPPLGHFFMALLASAAAVIAWSANEVVNVSAGADGIRIRRLLSRARFLPFSTIASAEWSGADVTIRMRDGSVVQMHSGSGVRLHRDRAKEGRSLVERINTQVTEHRRDVVGVEVLARGARETREWLREVALASDEHASFRAPALPPDGLWRVVEDAAAATTARAGAALALRSRLDDNGRARLRVAADACAAPELRAALERAASDASTESLEDVFDDLDDEVRRRMAR